MSNPEKYDWNKWFNGEAWILRHGIDFYPSPLTFQKQIYQAARRKGKKVSAIIDMDQMRILVQAIDPNTAMAIIPSQVLAPIANQAKNQLALNIINKMQADNFMELRYPNDFTCTARKMAAIVNKLATEDGIDTSDWLFDYSRKDILRVYAGELAESHREQERKQTDNLLDKKVTQGKVTLDMLMDWFNVLKREYYLQLWFGRDYTCTTRKLMALICSEAEDFGIAIGNIKMDTESLTISLRDSKGELVEQPYLLEQDEDTDERSEAIRNRDWKRLAEIDGHEDGVDEDDEH